jgi:hypothetical protein
LFQPETDVNSFSSRKLKYLEQGGGYYIDVGASSLIITGAITIYNGASPTRITPHGIHLSDNSFLPADEIVFATGYENMLATSKKIFGSELARKVGEVWGLDEEGELKGVWRRSGHSGFWFAGGNLALCRWYSRLLALQIKGIEVGLFNNEEL